MPYIGKSPSAVGVRNRFYFTASGGETSLSGSDDNGKTLVFSDASYVDVILNGGNLVSGTDYTATPSTNTISGLTALVANDVVEIIAYDVFSVSDTVSAASGGTFQSNVNFDSGIDVTGNATFADNGKAIFGAGSDLQIYSNGSSSFIQEGGSGELNILGTDIYFINSANNEYLATFTTDGGVSLRYDNSTKLATTSTGVDITGTVTMDGASTSGDITFGDNNKAIFGAGSDLQIYHNGTSASYITDQGTGNLVLGGDIAIILQNSAHNANMLDAYNGGRVGLYHANSLKLATTATGVDVTGTVTADGLTAYSGVADAESRLIKFGYSSVGDWALTRDNAATGDFYVQSGVSGTYTTRATYHLNGDISFYDSLGSSQSFFWDASTQRLGLGTTSPAVKLAVQNDSSTAFNPSTAAFNTVATLKNSTGGASTNALLSFSTEANGEWYIGGVQNSGNTAADFVFASRNGGTRAERMRIDSSGNVSIGSINPQFNLHLNNLVTIPNGRYLTDFFGTYEVSSANHHVMISVDDDTSTANPKAVGITLHNESQTDNTFAPAITWGNQSNSGNFSQSTAAIAGRRTTQGSDPNWHGGELYFYTAVSSGGTGLRTRMVIDAAGRVTMPYQPAFVAVDDRGLADQSIANINISQYFTTVRTNIGNGYNASTGRFTAPVTGYYVFGWNLFTTSTSADTSSRVGIIHNGSASEFSGGDRVGHANQGSIGFYLNANDYVQLGTQGGSYTAYWYSSGQHARFWGYLVG